MNMAPQGVGSAMSRGATLVAAVFSIALAVVVGNRLSNDALTVIVGVLCGLMASVPFSLALVVALKQNWGQPVMSREEFQPRLYGAQPPVILVSPPPTAVPQPYGIAPNQLYLPPNAPVQGAPREFKIIGEE